MYADNETTHCRRVSRTNNKARMAARTPSNISGRVQPSHYHLATTLHHITLQGCLDIAFCEIWSVGNADRTSAGDRDTCTLGWCGSNTMRRTPSAAVSNHIFHVFYANSSRKYEAVKTSFCRTFTTEAGYNKSKGSSPDLQGQTWPA